MRAEERHKMHRNDLSEWLGEWGERIKPYSNAIFIAVMAVAVGVAAVAYWVRQSRAEQALAWDGYYRAVATRNALELEGVAAQYSGTRIGQCAALSVADIHLAEGCQRLFVNKPEARKDLEKAVEHYLIVREESREPMLLEQACYGLGRAYEAQGDLEKAIEAYREVIDAGSSGSYAEPATRRLEDLQRRETKGFYDQFAQFEPQPAGPPPPGALGGSLPFDLGALSEDAPLPGPTGASLPRTTGAIRPDWTEETKAPPSEDDSPLPGEAGPIDSPPAQTSPAEGAEPPPSPEEGVEPVMPAQPDEPAAQPPSDSQEASDPAAPEPNPTSQPAPAEETSELPPPAEQPSDSPPPAEEGASDSGPTSSTQPSEPSP